MAALYLERRALPARSTVDALHVAHATLHQMDVLVSFNFKHWPTSAAVTVSRRSTLSRATATP